jgi:MFS family permease
VNAGKWRHLGCLALAESCAMVLWFSASAVVPQLVLEWNLSAAQQAWMTMSVQLGFICGALASALLNLPDRTSLPRLFAACAIAGACLNAAIPLFEPPPAGVLALRFLTGVTLAGVYPPAMKLVGTWAKRDLGLGIGILVGALTAGSATPHLLNALPIFGAGGMPPWRDVLWTASALALFAAAVVGLFVRPGPHLSRAAPFDWRFVGRTFRDKPVRLANFGYLGHMWELYAMWTWAPVCLMASYEAAGRDLRDARLAGFATIAIGAPGCVLAGLLADRLGRTRVAAASLCVSGTCALVAGFCFTSPALLTLVCLVWGFAVVADSAQFSAAVSELTDPRYVGTALTMQTCLGFGLTLLTIRLVPALLDDLGWEWIFSLLAIGPLFGAVSMLRLRALPDAARMASGNR